MSVIYEAEDGSVICHEAFMREILTDAKKGEVMLNLTPHKHMFLINAPYARDAEARKAVSELNPVLNTRKRRHKSSLATRNDIPEGARNAVSEKVENIKTVAKVMLEEARKKGLFTYNTSDEDLIDNNQNARKLSEKIYSESQNIMKVPFEGGNNSDENVIEKVGSEYFVFPKRCRFYCRDVFEMESHLNELGRFDFIVVDPPWWNKYIRRKKARCSSEGYKMINCETLKDLPFNQLLSPQGIIAVWCTNADGHQNVLRDILFPAWNVKQIACWTWLKVTRSGDPVCSFSKPPGKQPFEQLIIGISLNNSGFLSLPVDGKLIMSVPSAIHSHKPPLQDLFRPYLSENPRCLEVFARYLLPYWTSWGLEVCKLMHQSLFTTVPVSSDEQKVF